MKINKIIISCVTLILAGCAPVFNIPTRIETIEKINDRSYDIIASSGHRFSVLKEDAHKYKVGETYVLELNPAK